MCFKSKKRKFLFKYYAHYAQFGLKKSVFVKRWLTFIQNANGLRYNTKGNRNLSIYLLKSQKTM